MTPPAGRPEVGTPINVRLGDELLARVDNYAEHQKISRAEAVRRLVAASLADFEDEQLT